MPDAGRPRDSSANFAILVTWLGAWTRIGRWFADRSVTTVTMALPAAIALVAAAVSFPGIRRVVP